MSQKKNEHEAHRWLSTAKEDLETAILLRDNKKYSHSCYLCQQVAEKAVKALYYFLDLDPWGHSISKLVDELKEFGDEYFALFEKYLEKIKILDRFYIPTRYPNGLPDLTPAEAFCEMDANSGIQIAAEIFNIVEETLFRK